MSAVAVHQRTCRTCPAVISEHGETGQCRPCQRRPEAVPAVAAPYIRYVKPFKPFRPTPSRMKPAAPPKLRTCEQDGHHACPHFLAIFKSLKNFQDDADFCWVCGADAEGDDQPHAEGCAYQAIESSLVSATPAAEREPAARGAG